LLKESQLSPIWVMHPSKVWHIVLMVWKRINSPGKREEGGRPIRSTNP